MPGPTADVMHGSIRRVMLMFTKSQNVPGMLEQAAAVFRDAAGQLPPVSRQELAQRARHFASAVRFGLDEPGAMLRLHEATGGLRDVSSLRRLLPRVLDGALWLMASLDETMSRFAGDIVHRLFSIGLSLDSASGIAADGPAGDRVAAVTGELDRLIRDIRAIVFGPADHRQRLPGPRPGPVELAAWLTRRSSIPRTPFRAGAAPMRARINSAAVGTEASTKTHAGRQD